MILFVDNVKNNIKICIILMGLKITIIYTLYLYKFYFNKYNKYIFLILLIDISKNNIKIYIILINIKKITIYTIYLYKFI